MIFLSGSAIFSRIFNALTQREGKRVTLPTLVSVTGLTENQIKNSIANARRTSAVHARQIEVVKLGREWKFKGDKSVGDYPTPEKIASEVAMGSTHIWKTVLAALMSNVGKVTSKELLAELASTEERTITPIQAANAMLTIMRQPGMADKIETLWAGNAWRYVETAESSETPKTSKTKTKTTTSVPVVSVPIRGSVLRYFAQHPGETLFRDDIAEDLGFTVKQVQGAMWHLLNENDTTKNDFVIVQSSYAWQYVPNRQAKAESNGHVTTMPASVPAAEYTPSVATTTLPAASKVSNTPKAEPTSAAVATATSRLFEEIGTLSNGGVLVKESESGAIYRATPLA